MPIYTSESLDNLRQRIDLIDVISSQVELKRSGSTYKGLCPFHDEKTPSFMVQKGDRHYHCFGCGAHGDAIQFLMDFNRMSFGDAVEHLAQRFGVVLDLSDEKESGPKVNKGAIRKSLEAANQLFQFILLHTEEGHQALKYLFNRGIDIEFIRRFQIGLAPKARDHFFKPMEAQKFGHRLMEDAGLVAPARSGGYRTFFYDRITFPIHDPMGQVIGFSARKYKEDTFGGKYVNSTETAVFKKSRTLFGLNYCRRRITKEQRVIIVEGQLDALRLIHHGFDITVAGQGTAFGQGHAKELLNLGVSEVFLALDSDEAGQEAAAKIGNLFQKEGVAVKVVKMPVGGDPDTLLMEQGPEAFQKLIEGAQDYLDFLVEHHGRYMDLKTPSGKNSLVSTVAQQIRAWDQPVMVHESLRKLARLVGVPEGVLGVDQQVRPNMYTRHSGSVSTLGRLQVDPDRILEGDVVRWLLLRQHDPVAVDLGRLNLKPEDFISPLCRAIFEKLIASYDANEKLDLLGLASSAEHPEMQSVIAEILDKKVNQERWEVHLRESIQRVLNRNWMRKRDGVQARIQAGGLPEDEVMQLLKEFDELRRQPPELIEPKAWEETVQ